MTFVVVKPSSIAPVALAGNKIHHSEFSYHRSVANDWCKVNHILAERFWRLVALQEGYRDVQVAKAIRVML